MPVTATGAAEALAAIGADLHAGLAAVQWVVNVFFLAFAGLMATTGSLADRIGRRAMFTGGLALFTAAMLTAAFAPGIGVLILARAAAGAGAAAVTTGGTALLARAFPEGPARLRAFAAFGTTIGLGLAFGPVVAGLLVTSIGWRSLFGAAAILLLPALLATPLLTESRSDTAAPMDWGGAATFTLGLTGFALAVVEGPDIGWTDPVVLGGFTTCVVLLAAFAVIERKHPLSLLGAVAVARLMSDRRRTSTGARTATHERTLAA